MSRFTRAAAGLLVGLALLGTASCAEPQAVGADRTSARKAAFDRSLHDRLPQAVRDRGVLRVGTDASYAPMSSFAADGRTIVGVEPDRGTELGRVLGVRVEFVDTDFTEVIPDVAAGRLDLGMSAITDTRARARHADFVNYFSAGTSILVQQGNPAGVTDIRDLCGNVVAVERGTTQVDLLARAQRNCADERVARRITVRTYPTNSDALVELRTGRAVAVLNDLPPAAFLVNDPLTKPHYQLASDTQYEPGLYGIAVAKDRLDLRDAVQGACEALIRSGAYADVLARWGVRDGAVARISVNSER
jgi:polar amino acid transport system substrate-binding protein